MHPESRGAPKVEFPLLKIGDLINNKSDGEKNKTKEQYFVLKFVPNRNEIEVQKLSETRNKHNVITVQLQNVYKVEEEANHREITNSFFM